MQTLTPVAATLQGKLHPYQKNTTEIRVQGWKVSWKFKGKILVVKEPRKKNDPNSEHTISKPRLIAKLCTKQGWITDADTCNNQDES